ncbi:MAG: hypothetical protein EOQ69_15160 [Mesorhizobium sp.]|nr:MAG: hypothetical protein EOQ69_15160 [Mesorhizobium sp.]
MNLAHVARLLGGQVTGRNSIAIPTPGHSRNDRGTTITFDASAPGGFLVHSFNGGDPIEIKDTVRAALGLPVWEPGDGQDRRIPPHSIRKWDTAAVDAGTKDGRRTDDDLIRIRRAQEIWAEAGHPRGTLAEIYLKEQRKLDLGDDVAGRVLRFHPRCPWRDENTGRTVFLPAIIAAFRSVDDDTLTAVHRIGLTSDGAKIGRRMLGVMHRTAVKLDGLGIELAIGEGVETAMAARQLGIGVPVWALGSAGAISFFPVIEGVKRLHVLAEAGEASQQAIRICGRRWKRAGRRVFIRQPHGFSDFNDQLMAIRQ